jgi:hypothetical protein
VGNKTDQENRKVSYQQGLEMSERYKMQFVECSAKNGSNISNKVLDFNYSDKIFEDLGQEMKGKLQELENQTNQETPQGNSA